jgi:spermidine/putrescine transport system substrate-binding protein
MNRRTFFLGMAGLAGCTRDHRPRLNVYNWSAYVAPETVPGFEAEFGVRVRYSTYESNEEMLAKVLTGNSGWDVVFPTHNRLLPMRENGLLAPLRHEWLPGLANLEPRFQTPAWDPGLESGVPYMWTATGILYNKAVAPPPKRWADLWEPRLKGRLTMLDDPEDMLGACLKKLGLSFNATDAGELDRAKREAIAQKPLLRAYLNAEVRDQVVAGDVLAAQLWSTTAAQVLDANPNLAFAYPTEGFPFFCDCAAILRESRRGRLAHHFLEYLLRPAVSARIVEFTKTGTANEAARRLVPAVLRDSPALNPPAEVVARGEWPKTLPPAAQRLRDRIWTEIKSA